MNISKSPAGVEPVVGENQHFEADKQKVAADIAEFHLASREATAASIAAIPGDVTGKKYANEVKRITAINAPGAQKGYNVLLGLHDALEPANVEICCPESGFHVWATTEEKATLLWNRGVEKLLTLKDCCKQEANQTRVGTDGGFHIVRCKVCGQRHVPQPKG